jgi:hypothetical protein
MYTSRVYTAWIVYVGAFAMTAGGEVLAQTTASRSTINQGLGTSSATTNNQATAGMLGTGMDMGMGMGYMPYGMFGSPTPSATDAAALGMTRPTGGMMGMGGLPNNVFMNPMASPMLYGSMFPMTPQQSSMLFLAGQAQMFGPGSGQLSGVRPGPGSPSAAKGRQAQQARPRGSLGVPGGSAGHYFHRTTQMARIPQRYYSHQNRYYPQVGR